MNETRSPRSGCVPVFHISGGLSLLLAVPCVNLQGCGSGPLEAHQHAGIRNYLPGSPLLPTHRSPAVHTDLALGAESCHLSVSTKD